MKKFLPPDDVQYSSLKAVSQIHNIHNVYDSKEIIITTCTLIIHVAN